MNTKRKILLVGWDAADWKVISPLVDEGLMPNVSRLVETGVMGNLATLNPILSPMLWTSIATGKRPYKHGIHGFAEPDPNSGGVRPITNLSRKTKAVWNILNQQGKKSLVVGWWPSSPAEPINGVMVSNHFQQAVAPLDKPWPMRAGTIHPPELQETLAPLRIHPHELEGDMLRSFVPRAPEIDQERDKRLASVAKIFAECSGIHAAATHLIETTPDWDFAAVYYDAIDHFGHAFMKYHPPRLDWIDEEDFDLYKAVVRGAYIYHDMMLGALLRQAGPETTVILMSDHGFHPDHLRPKSLPNEPAGPAAEHRQFGIFVANGPGIKQDELVFGASLLDVTPTVLSLFGLPVGGDMDGRVLESIYQEPQEIEYIDSWDAINGDDGRHPPEAIIYPVDSREAIKQLVDLGYIDEPDDDQSKAVDETTRELQYNLARAYDDGGKLHEAAEIFSQNWERWPDESRFGVHLLQTQMSQQHVLAARDTMTLLRQRKQSAAESASSEIAELVKRLQDEYPVSDATKGDKSAGDASENDKASNPVSDNATDTDNKPDGDRQIDWEAVPDRDKLKLRRLRDRVVIDPRSFAFLEGSLLHLEGRYDESIKMLGEAESAQTANLPSLYLKMGEVCISKRDWSEAKKHYEAVVDLDPLNAQAHFGLARVALHQKNWQTAAREASTSIGQHFHFAPAHLTAGIALWRLGEIIQAKTALQRSVAINPHYPAGHRTLATFNRKELGNWPAYEDHLRRARESKRRMLQSEAGVFPDNAAARQTTNSPENMNELEVCSTVDAPKLPPFNETITIVSGLPRSGTSMMMQMLAAGGVSIYSDDHRHSDDSNLRGYYEHQNAKRLASNSEWIGEVQGQAVKIVAQLLQNLPQQYRYRIILMNRPLDEVVSSQKKMLARLGKEGASISEEALKRTFSRQLMQMRTMLTHYRKLGMLDFIDVNYNECLLDSGAIAQTLARFIDDLFDIQSAAKAVVPSMRREHAG